MTMGREHVAIRPALRGDIAAIRNVARLAWASAYEEIIPHEIQDQAIANWYSDEALVAVIESAESVLLLAERGNVIVGLVNLHRRSPQIVHLTRIYLLPNDQRNGLGTRLLDAALALTPGVEKMMVEVEERNQQARNFYERYGLTATSTKTIDIFGFPLPLVGYEKNIQ